MSVEAETTAFANQASPTTVAALAGGSTSADRICFLTRVYIEETDSVNEEAECRVQFNGGTGWSLTAHIGLAGAQNAIADCAARCLSW